MANKKITLKDQTNTDELYPATLTSNVFDDNANSLDTILSELDDAIGDLSTLTTTNKSNLVSAINEVNLKIPKFVKMFTFVNASSMEVPLTNAPSSSTLSTCIVVNGNQSVLSSLAPSSSGNVLVNNYGGKALKGSVSGSTLIIQRDDNSTLWGCSLVILGANYSLN